MLRRQCTAEYKIDVCEKIIRRQVVGLEPRQRMPKDIRIVQYFGLSFDEPRRGQQGQEQVRRPPVGARADSLCSILR